ncbi:carbohydrate sulfotransferase 4-like [Trichosurus vulpecula]|uniref:carbohydrate sulfotransferase 4-like n=1 Tax=Trichosurus vulpecula TaxID=9337 RepID=UPI00186AC351|nr:carbohydrate sulfotransferase 4-like [Trichosurus vulpecula]
MFWANKARLLVLLVLPSLAFLFLQQFYSHSQCPGLVEKSSPMHVLILSSWRSGSSFVGQLFSQHPDVFYLMEPAWHVWTTLSSGNAWQLQMAVRDLIRSVFLCDMSVFDAYMAQGPRKQSSLFMWETSRALCSPPACHLFKRESIVPQDDCKILCSKQPFNLVEEACKSYSHVVLKEVRFFNLKTLQPLLTDPSLNLHIIHLVRDPRAVFRSRENTKRELNYGSHVIMGKQWNKIKSEDQPYHLMTAICLSQQEIYKAAQLLPDSLRERYLLIRYEDLVQDPLTQTSKLYEFAGLRFLPHLQIWVRNLTQGKGMGGRAFDTNSRNAQSVSQAWRRSLPHDKVVQLQKICKDYMNLMGYLPVLSEKDQKNLSVNLLSAVEFP